MSELPDDSNGPLLTALASVHVQGIESFQALIDPSELIVCLETEGRGPAPTRRMRFAMQFYSQFIELTAAFPLAEQNSLIRATSHAFGIRVRRMRADIKRARVMTAQAKSDS